MTSPPPLSSLIVSTFISLCMFCSSSSPVISSPSILIIDFTASAILIIDVTEAAFSTCVVIIAVVVAAILVRITPRYQLPPNYSVKHRRQKLLGKLCFLLCCNPFRRSSPCD